MVEVSRFLFTWSKQIFDSLLSDWGIIGTGLIAAFILVRVANFMRRFFK